MGAGMLWDSLVGGKWSGAELRRSVVGGVHPLPLSSLAVENMNVIYSNILIKRTASPGACSSRSTFVGFGTTKSITFN